MKKYPCLETTIDARINKHDIRLWINSGKLELEWDEMMNYKQWIEKLNVESIEEIIKKAEKYIPNLNAIQIRSDYGIGKMVYFVDF